MTAALPVRLVGQPQAATYTNTHNPAGAGMSMAARRLAALAQIETNNRDNPPGTDLSRYGISRPVWIAYTAEPVSQATNRWTAAQVASRILRDRIATFTTTHGHPPTEQQVYLLWWRPAYCDHPSAAQSAVAQRFANLVNEP